MIGRLVFVVAGAAAGAFATWKLAVEPWYREWGVDPTDAERTLAGDDMLPAPTVVETRRIEIDAPPGRVWPWLVQMGYGRAGWYSYDAVDMAGKSAARIEPEWQSLAAGDIVQTFPGGGFEVKAIDPGRSLVLYLDSAMVEAQAKASQDKGNGHEATAANVRATGAAMSTGFPKDFAASWSFILEPLTGERTLLIERIRANLGEGTPVTRLAGPLMGFGVFVMARKQMLGIRDRAEMSVTEAESPTAAEAKAAGVIDVSPEPAPEASPA